MREESCPQRIGKSHRLHPAEEVAKGQHAAVLAPLCAPRTSITAAAMAWAAHAEALMTFVATLTSIPQRAEDSGSVCFQQEKRTAVFFPLSEGSRGVATAGLAPCIPHTCTCFRTHVPAKNTGHKPRQQTLRSLTNTLELEQSHWGESKVHSTHKEAPRALCAYYLMKVSDGMVQIL